MNTSSVSERMITSSAIIGTSVVLLAGVYLAVWLSDFHTVCTCTSAVTANVRFNIVAP